MSELGIFSRDSVFLAYIFVCTFKSCFQTYESIKTDTINGFGFIILVYRVYHKYWAPYLLTILALKFEMVHSTTC